MFKLYLSILFIFAARYPRQLWPLSSSCGYTTERDHTCFPPTSTHPLLVQPNRTIMLSNEAGANGVGYTSNSGDWQCPKCTFANPPSRYHCEMCHTDRSANGGASLNGGPFDQQLALNSPPVNGAPNGRYSPFTDRHLDFSTRPPLNEVWVALLCRVQYNIIITPKSLYNFY